MSINIPSSIVRIADPIQVTIRYDRLGKNQQTQLARFIGTRVFLRRGIVPWLGKGLYNKVFGDKQIGWVQLDNWRLVFHYLDLKDCIALADTMEQTLLVGTLHDDSQVWSENQRVRLSWRKVEGDDPDPSGFEMLEQLMAKLRRGDIAGFEQYIHLSDVMSNYMQEDFTKRLTNPKKNTSVLPLHESANDLAERLRSGEITSFTCLASEV